MRHWNKIWLVILALGSACAPWSLVGGPFVSSSDSYEVNLPAQWRKANFSSGGLALTKDGMLLQRVVIGRHPIDQDAPHTKRKLSSEMLPHDVAEVVMDDFRSDRQKLNFLILESAPAKVGGNSGFRIVYSYQTGANLKKMGMYYGALDEKWLYFLNYEAPARHYFERDQQTFENIAASFKILK